MNTNYLAQLTSQPSLLVVLPQAGFLVEENIILYLVDIWLNKGKQDNHKKTKYVQISVESYTHLTGLEDEVKSYEDRVNSYEDQVKTFEDQVTSYEVQVTSYEDQVKALEDEVEELNEKLSATNSELTTKESLVKQHAKVAEEAVSGFLGNFSFNSFRVLLD